MEKFSSKDQAKLCEIFKEHQPQRGLSYVQWISLSDNIMQAMRDAFAAGRETTDLENRIASLEKHTTRLDETLGKLALSQEPMLKRLVEIMEYLDNYHGYDPDLPTGS